MLLSRMEGRRSKGVHKYGQISLLYDKRDGVQPYYAQILSTYPCLAPADSTAFRISLAKYLETLRHNALYSKTASRVKDKDKEVAPDFVQAWWWRDTVVRKTHLEECGGER